MSSPSTNYFTSPLLSLVSPSSSSTITILSQKWSTNNLILRFQFSLPSHNSFSLCQQHTSDKEDILLLPHSKAIVFYSPGLKLTVTRASCILSTWTAKEVVRKLNIRLSLPLTSSILFLWWCYKIHSWMFEQRIEFGEINTVNDSRLSELHGIKRWSCWGITKWDITILDVLLYDLMIPQKQYWSLIGDRHKPFVFEVIMRSEWTLLLLLLEYWFQLSYLTWSKGVFTNVGQVEPWLLKYNHQVMK